MSVLTSTEYSRDKESPHSFNAVFQMWQGLLRVRAGDHDPGSSSSIAELKPCSATTSSALETTSAAIYYMSFSSHLCSRLTRRGRRWSTYLWTEGVLLLLGETSKKALMKPEPHYTVSNFSSIFQSSNLLFFPVWESTGMFSHLAISSLETHTNGPTSSSSVSLFLLWDILW